MARPALAEKPNTKPITFRLDSNAKTQAEAMLDDMGINMTTYLVSSIKALIREKRIPFDMVTSQYATDQDIAARLMVTSQYVTDQDIAARLIETEKEAADPNTQWLTHEEVFAPLREKYGYEVQS